MNDNPTFRVKLRLKQEPQKDLGDKVLAEDRQIQEALDRRIQDAELRIGVQSLSRGACGDFDRLMRALFLPKKRGA